MGSAVPLIKIVLLSVKIVFIIDLIVVIDNLLPQVNSYRIVINLICTVTVVKQEVVIKLIVSVLVVYSEQNFELNSNAEIVPFSIAFQVVEGGKV